MRICLYTDTALPKMGGQEIVVDALARQFLALGHHPIVFAPKPRKLSIRGEIYPYEVVRHPRFYSTQYFVGWYRRYLLQLYQKQPFDILHCHGIYPPSYLASLLGKDLPVPLVITSHGGDVYEHNVRLQKSVIVDRAAQGLRAASTLVAISRFTRDGFARLCPEVESRIVDVPNGVHVEALQTPAPKPSEPWLHFEPGSYAIFLGRLKQRKGVDILLRSLARVNDTGKTQLVIVGDGEERTFLEILCDQLDLRGRVAFVGTVTGATKTWLLQNARFGVIPSRQWEAFGLVVLEGYAAGLPMIGTNMPGLADLIESETTGLLVPPESPEALATAMDRLFADDALLKRMSAGARAKVQEFDWRNVALRHLELYERLIQSQRAIAA